MLCWIVFKEDAMIKTKPEEPSPGSPAAVVSGCTCPVMDNYHGEGFPALDADGGRRTAYWIAADCPLHGTKPYPEVMIEQQGN